MTSLKEDFSIPSWTVNWRIIISLDSALFFFWNLQCLFFSSHLILSLFGEHGQITRKFSYPYSYLMKIHTLVKRANSIINSKLSFFMANFFGMLPQNFCLNFEFDHEWNGRAVEMWWLDLIGNYRTYHKNEVDPLLWYPR